jgi:hypothetical protein
MHHSTILVDASTQTDDDGFADFMVVDSFSDGDDEFDDDAFPMSVANPESARVGMSLVWKARRLRGCVVAARASFIIRVSRPITHSNHMTALVENADSRSVGPFGF